MTPRFLTACEAFQPAEKACWEILLRERLKVGSVPAAELEAAMERTLTQLWSLLRARSVEEWMNRTPAEPPPGWLPKECGLEMMLAYFGTGQRALDLILAEIEPGFHGQTEEERAERRVELGLAFNVLVQRGLDAMCGDCVRNRSCTLNGRRKADAALPAAGSPAAANKRPPARTKDAAKN